MRINDIKPAKSWAFGLICLLSVSLFTACFDLENDEKQDKVEKVTIYVSAETGTYYDLFDDKRERPMEGMKIRYSPEERWECVPLQTIQGFEYEKGYEYVLLVKRTTLANPPADGSMYTFELLRVISKKQPKD